MRVNKRITKIVSIVIVCSLVIVAVSVIASVASAETSAKVSTTTTTLAPATTTTTLDPAAVKAWNEAVWFAAVAENQRQAEAAKKAAAAKATRAKASRSSSSATPAGLNAAQNACAIPDYICRRESNMTTNAKNPHSTASGKYQFLDSTWNGYGGYAHASDAPEAVQDQKAAELWNNGRGCSHWSAC